MSMSKLALRACYILMAYWLAIAILQNVAFPHDAGRDIRLAAEKCYEQNLRAVLIDGSIRCRSQIPEKKRSRQ